MKVKQVLTELFLVSFGITGKATTSKPDFQPPLSPPHLPEEPATSSLQPKEEEAAQKPKAPAPPPPPKLPAPPKLPVLPKK